MNLLKDRVDLRFEVWGFSAVTIVRESSFDRKGKEGANASETEV